MTERDPRLDPRPGDVLQKGAQTIEIKGVDRGFHYLFSGYPLPVELLIDWNRPWRPAWRKWAATAEVISRGAE